MNWNIFKLKEPAHAAEARDRILREFAEKEELGEEHAVVMDFDRTIDSLVQLSPKAQVTFLYRLVGVLPSGVVRTLNGYLLNRIHGKTTNKRQDERNADRAFTREDTNIG